MPPVSNPSLANPNIQPQSSQEQTPNFQGSQPDLKSTGKEVEPRPAVAAPEHPPTGVSTPTSLAAPAQSQPPRASAARAQPTIVTPSLNTDIAADVDAIEKVWVDRADAIITAQQADPYAQEQLLEDLSAEYLQKRFNLTIKRSNPTAR